MRTVSAVLRQPTQIGTNLRTDQLRPTERHVPGWVLRVALAAAWITANGVPSRSNSKREEFLHLFENGSVRYPPLYAGRPPSSLGTLKHKYPLADSECGDRDLAKEFLATSPNQTNSGENTDRCPTCGDTMVQRRGLPDATYVTVRRHTSTQVTDAGVAQEGVIYSRDSIVPKHTFSAQLIADQSLLDVLVQLGRVQFGGRKTSHGLADLEFGPEQGDPDGHPLVEGDLLVLRLSSPAVFVTSDGRPSLVPESAQLQRILGVSSATILRSWARWGTVGGWHAASKLPKPVETVAVAGSTYVVKLGEVPTVERLITLQRVGLGIRRHEGFGHLIPEDGDTIRRDTRILKRLPTIMKTEKHRQAIELYASGQGDNALQERVSSVAKGANQQVLLALLDRSPDEVASLVEQARSRGDW